MNALCLSVNHSRDAMWGHDAEDEMRVDKKDPRRVYRNYWDWLRTGSNYVWTISLMFGYLYYLMTTQEV